MRRGFVGVLATVILVAMVSTVWHYLHIERQHPELTLSEISGEVRLQRPNANQIEPARGMLLLPSDRLATGARSRAVLTLGRDTHVRMGPTSSIQVVAVDESGVSLELEDGALRATVRPESGAVQIANQGRAVLATRGEFEVGVDEDILQIRTLDGTASLSGLDQTRLETGQQATVIDRHADVGPIPEELLLAIDWPDTAQRTRGPSSILSGTTAPRARVRLSGSFGERLLRADEEGYFEAEIPLQEGPNPVEVEATDALGQRRHRVGSLQIRDTRGPTFRGGVEYDQ